LHDYFPLQVRGLYRGASSSFIGIALESSLFFGTYAQAKQLLQVFLFFFVIAVGRKMLVSSLYLSNMFLFIFILGKV
jgi:hypothetical protein